MALPTVGGPFLELRGNQDLRYEELKAISKAGDLHATILASNQILYEMLAIFDVRLERLEKHLKIIDE